MHEHKVVFCFRLDVAVVPGWVLINKPISHWLNTLTECAQYFVGQERCLLMRLNAFKESTLYGCQNRLVPNIY